MLSSSRFALSMLTAFVLAPIGAGAALPVDVVLNPKPQATLDTCQSYALALAAASVPGTTMPASTVDELRASEKEIRAAITAAAAGGDTSDHKVWRKAIEQVSNGSLVLHETFTPTFEGVLALVAEKTGQANISSPLLAGIMVHTPVMTSVRQIGSDRREYKSGHIVTLLGVYDTHASPAPIAVLNGGIRRTKDAPSIPACSETITPGDRAYVAEASREVTYTPKQFDGGFLAMWVEKK